MTRRGAQCRGRALQGVGGAGDASAGSGCPICQEAYGTLKFPVVHAPCGHVACAPCSLTWQKKKRERTCALCRTPVLSLAHCALLEQQMVQWPAVAAGRGGAGAETVAQDSAGTSASASRDHEAERAEIKKGLWELSAGDLNFIPGDYRAHLVRVAARRAIRKGDLTMLEICLRNLKARASAHLVCEAAGLWKKAPRPALSLLLAHGARLDGHRHDRPLLHAIYCGNLQMAEALIEMRADPAKPACGETPLHVAVRRGRPEAVKLLLAHGAPVDVADPSGRTPQLMAEMGFHVHCMACNRRPCSRCRARFDVRCQVRKSAAAVAAATATDMPRPTPVEHPSEPPGAPGTESESEDSSSNWEESESDVSDLDDWAEDGEEEDQGEGEEEEEEDEDEASDPPV